MRERELRNLMSCRDRDYINSLIEETNLFYDKNKKKKLGRVLFLN